jgi:hypothetical protein
MRKTLTLSVVALLVFIIGAASMACNDDDDGGSTTDPTSDGGTSAPTSDGGSTSTYCADLAELDAALDNLDATLGSGSPAETEQAADDVEAAFRKVEASAEGEIDELEAAWRDLDNQIRQDPSAADELLASVRAELNSLSSEANC